MDTSHWHSSPWPPGCRPVRPAQWTARARAVTSADPGMLIDGDQWSVPAAEAVAQAVQRIVYGTAAPYVATAWGSGRPIPPRVARLLGEIYAAGAQRRQGVARSQRGSGRCGRGRSWWRRRSPRTRGWCSSTRTAAAAP